MYLTQHQTLPGPRWAVDGRFLPPGFSLAMLLALPRPALAPALAALVTPESAGGPLLPPIEPLQEVWAAGVTYQRSQEARAAESTVADVYTNVYHAARPELFFKAAGWRVAGDGMPIAVRLDSDWSVPEPELTLVVNAHGEIVGYCAGNDVSSRDIEGQNPLYLPQAKIYTGACALGPGLQLAGPEEMANLPVRMEIRRDEDPFFMGETGTGRMRRSLEELVAYLVRALDFPYGVFLMTGTGIVPPDEYNLRPGDMVCITVGALRLENEVRGDV